jgi:hypothetical protein
LPGARWQQPTKGLVEYYVPILSYKRDFPKFIDPTKAVIYNLSANLRMLLGIVREVVARSLKEF